MIPRISVLMVITIMIYCYFHDIIITIIIIFIIIILISDDLSEDPKDGRLPASQIWNNDIINIYKYAHDSMKSSKYIINKIKLKWVRNFFNNIKRTLKSVQCDLLIYGNARDFNSDVLLIDTAKSLSIPVITELLNLFIDSELLPHVIIAPSTYAAEHDSISSVSQPINTLDQHPSHHHHPFTIIIPPSVDTNRFRPYDDMFGDGLTSTPPYHHPSCNIISNSIYQPPPPHHHHPCVVIGFIARLAPGITIPLIHGTTQSALLSHCLTNRSMFIYYDHHPHHD